MPSLYLWSSYYFFPFCGACLSFLFLAFQLRVICFGSIFLYDVKNKLPFFFLIYRRLHAMVCDVRRWGGKRSNCARDSMYQDYYGIWPMGRGQVEDTGNFQSIGKKSWLIKRGGENHRGLLSRLICIGRWEKTGWRGAITCRRALVV